MRTDFQQAFRLMWQLFPEPALLVRRDRTVIECNRAARRMGIVPGMKCEGLGGIGEAERALCTRDAARVLVTSDGCEVLAYWIPVAGSLDLCVYVGIGVMNAAFAGPRRRVTSPRDGAPLNTAIASRVAIAPASAAAV